MIRYKPELKKLRYNVALKIQKYYRERLKRISHGHKIGKLLNEKNLEGNKLLIRKYFKLSAIKMYHKVSLIQDTIRDQATSCSSKIVFAKSKLRIRIKIYK